MSESAWIAFEAWWGRLRGYRCSLVCGGGCNEALDVNDISIQKQTHQALGVVRVGTDVREDDHTVLRNVGCNRRG